MTERKPPGVSFETWADKQIREAEARGDFSDLPGFGKPLRDLDAPYDEQWWIKRKMTSEGMSLLSPTLALRKEAEDTLAAAPDARTEAQVRHLITTINAKILDALAKPQTGPPLNLKPFDVEQVVADWRARRG